MARREAAPHLDITNYSQNMAKYLLLVPHPRWWQDTQFDPVFSQDPVSEQLSETYVRGETIPGGVKYTNKYITSLI